MITKSLAFPFFFFFQLIRKATGNFKQSCVLLSSFSLMLIIYLSVESISIICSSG